MALHDVSKHDSLRLDPKANSSDTRAQRDAHGTNSVNYVTDATPAPVSNRTVGGGSGVKNGLKTLVGVVVMALANDGSTLTTVSANHNLSFVPKVEADLESSALTIAGGSGTATGATIALPVFTGMAIDVVDGILVPLSYLYTFADATKVYVNFLNATGNPVTFTITCYLYQTSGL